MDDNKKETKKSFSDILKLIITCGLYIIVLVFQDWLRLKEKEMKTSSLEETVDKIVDGSKAKDIVSKD